MKHSHVGLEDHFPFYMGDGCRFQPLPFQGVDAFLSLKILVQLLSGFGVPRTSGVITITKTNALPETNSSPPLKKEMNLLESTKFFRCELFC